MSGTLDRLVAEKVMGWTYRWQTNTGDTWIRPDGFVVGRWSPSTDMNAAMEVAQAVRNNPPLRDAHGGMADTTLQWNPYEGTWTARFSWSDAHERWWRNTNPATAICLAALAAVGVEYKEDKT